MQETICVADAGNWVSALQELGLPQLVPEQMPHACAHLPFDKSGMGRTRHTGLQEAAELSAL